MKHFNKIPQFLVLIFLVFVTTSSTLYFKKKNFDYGTIKDNKYTNSFFGFEMDIPEDWNVQSKEQTEHLMKVGKKMVAGDDKNLKAAISASEVNSANLLMVFKHEMGAPVDYNPNFMVVAENLKNAPGVKNGADYLFQCRKLLEISQVKYDTIDSEFKQLIINGQEFHVMNAAMSFMGMNIKQQYITTVKEGFALSCIVSYTTENQKEELDEVINSIQFLK